MKTVKQFLIMRRLWNNKDKGTFIQESSILVFIVDEEKEVYTGHFTSIVRDNKFNWYYCTDMNIEYIDDFNKKFVDDSTSLQNAYVMILNE